jgi:hypothetical protein
MPSKNKHLRIAALLVGMLLAGALMLNARQAARNEKEPPVRASVTIVSQNYCLYPDEWKAGEKEPFGSLVFLLNFRIENTSDRAVILCKECIQLAGEPALLSVKSDGTAGGIRNGGMNWDRFGSDPPRHDPARPDQRYAILKPHETFNGNYKTAILVSYDSPATYRGNLSPGSYFLQLEFLTWWWEETDTSGALRAKWEAYGDLYSDPLRPALVSVRIEIPDTLSTCPVSK